MSEEKIEGKVEVTKKDSESPCRKAANERWYSIFESGKAELTGKMVEILNKLAPRLKDFAGKVTTSSSRDIRTMCPSRAQFLPATGNCPQAEGNGGGTVHGGTASTAAGTYRRHRIWREPSGSAQRNGRRKAEEQACGLFVKNPQTTTFKQTQ